MSKNFFRNYAFMKILSIFIFI